VVKIKLITGKLKNGQLLSECGFVQNIAPPLLSLDKTIKMLEQNKHKIKLYKFNRFYRNVADSRAQPRKGLRGLKPLP